MHRWFSEHNQYEYVLLRDPDQAGVEWAQSVSASIRGAGGKVRSLKPPDKLDPDEAILNGWWPSAIYSTQSQNGERSSRSPFLFSKEKATCLH
jgi:hypothetical protein